MIALDTNILIYDAQTGVKSEAARQILQRASLIDCIVPLQVLAEFANACRRKNVLKVEAARHYIANYAGVFLIPPTSLNHIERAADLADRRMLSFFDALICTIAADAGATTLLSEDMQDGAHFGTLTILNPFLPANAARLDRLLGDPLT